MDYSAKLALIEIAATIAAIAGLGRWGKVDLGRRTATWLAALIVLVGTAEFWLLGRASFVQYSSEIIGGLSIHTFMARWGRFGHGAFAFGFGDGNDVAALMDYAGQFLSLERLLLSGLPLPGAVLVHKGLVFGLGLAGVYRIARGFAGASRAVALGLAGSFVFGDQFVNDITWEHGLGFPLLPLLAYLTVFRLGRRHYWAGVVAVAALNAVSSAPVHTGMATLAAIPLAALLLGWRGVVMVIPAMAVVLGVLLLNWGPTLAVKAAYAPLTYRGSAASHAMLPLIDSAIGTVSLDWPLALMALAGMATLLVRRSGHRGRAAMALLAACLSGPLLNLTPWQAVGLGPLAGVNFWWLNYAALPVLAAVAALGASAPQAPAWRRRIAVGVLAVMLGQMVWLKAFNLSSWLVEGGLANYAEMLDALDHRDWGRGETVRVVSVPLRLSPNLAAAAGLDAFDGIWHVILRDVALYWRDAVMRGAEVGEGAGGGYLRLDSPNIDLRCCESYAFDRLADPDALRLGNVGYVLSTVALTGLLQVAGPTGPAPLRRQGNLSERLKDYLALMGHAMPLRVYRLPDPLPRVFAARRIVELDPALIGAARAAMVVRQGLERAAVVDPGSGLTADPSLVVTEFSQEPDGMRIRVEAPHGGTVLVNLPYTPFWHAEIDGRPAPVKPANMIHMAIPVPPGAALVDLHYRRPLPAWLR